METVRSKSFALRDKCPYCVPDTEVKTLRGRCDIKVTDIY